MRRHALLVGIAILAGCSGGTGSPVAGIVGGAGVKPTASPSPVTASPTPIVTATPIVTPTPTPTPTPTAPATTLSNCSNPMTASIGAAGGSISANAATGTITETIAAGALASTTTVTYCYVAASALPAPLLRAPHRDAKTGYRSPMFTQGAGNTYVAAFTTSFNGSTLTTAASETGTMVVPSTIAAGTQLNIAMYNGTTWVDIATAIVSGGGNYSSSPPTVALPGVTAAGTYLVYEPAAGSNTSQINLGFALVADDGSVEQSGLQFVQLEDTNGNPLPTPTTTYFPVDGSDLDGQSLTPDAQQGAAVDGGSNVYFFSGIPQHSFSLANSTISVANYGGDGDSIVSLPSGDEAVVTADGGEPFAVISGILAGSPVIADTVTQGMDLGSPGLRDGLVISADGKTMLARGRAGLDVFSVTPSAAHAGSTGMGTTSYAFALTTTLESNGTTDQIPASIFEDGRDGMAVSPTDSSRAVVVGEDPITDAPEIVLLTGLNTASVKVNVLHPRFTPRPHRFGQVTRHPEAMPHRQPFALTPSAGTEIYAVTITPDGSTAYVSTDAGIVTVGGVASGTLAQVGAIYAPTITAPGTTCPLVAAPTLGILPDGKYLIAEINCDGISGASGSSDATQGYGVMVTIPIGAGGALGAPVGQLNNVVVPFNDQMIVH